MKEFEQEQTVIRQYLLGELDEEGRQKVEQRVMTERDYKEEVLITEEELLEDFVAGTLAERERRLFLENYLSAPLQRQKLRMAQAVNKYVIDKPLHTRQTAGASWFRRLIDVFRSRSWFVQLSWAVLVLVVIGGAWVAFQNWQSRSRQAELQAELERLNGPESNVLEPGASVLEARLASLNLRGGESAPALEITPETEVLQLRLAMPSVQYQRYRATLKDSKGAEVLEVPEVRVRSLGDARLVVLQIPARVLESDDYLLTLSGAISAGVYEEAGDYSFRILRVK